MTNPTLYYFPPAPLLSDNFLLKPESWTPLDNRPDPARMAAIMVCKTCGATVPVFADLADESAEPSPWRTGHWECDKPSRARMAAHLAEKHGIKED